MDICLSQDIKLQVQVLGCLVSWDTLYLSLLLSLTMTVWFLMCGLKSVKTQEKCENFWRFWSRGVLCFHSKGPVFEELALWKEWTCFQHYHFHRCLVFCECLVVGLFVCLFSLGTTALFRDNKYLFQNWVCANDGTHVLRWPLPSSL